MNTGVHVVTIQLNENLNAVVAIQLNENLNAAIRTHNALKFRKAFIIEYLAQDTPEVYNADIVHAYVLFLRGYRVHLKELRTNLRWEIMFATERIINTAKILANKGKIIMSKHGGREWIYTLTSNLMICSKRVD